MLKYTYRDRIGWRTNIFLSSLIQLFSARTIKHIKLISARNAWYEEIYTISIVKGRLVLCPAKEKGRISFSFLQND